MKLTCHNSQNLNIPRLLRSAGYHAILDRLAGKASWVRTMGRSHYPRFHLYISENSNSVAFNLHLDQKKDTLKLKGIKRHAGEYDGLRVTEEMERIERWIKYAQASRRL